MRFMVRPISDLGKRDYSRSANFGLTTIPSCTYLEASVNDYGNRSAVLTRAITPSPLFNT